MENWYKVNVLNNDTGENTDTLIQATSEDNAREVIIEAMGDKLGSINSVLLTTKD